MKDIVRACREMTRTGIVCALLLSAMISGLSGCATAQQPGAARQEREVSLDLNKQSVASVVPDKCTTGYGLKVMLSDQGYAQLQRLLSSRPTHLVFTVQGRMLTREMILGGSFPREFVWVKQVGIDELTKEQADDLVRKIMQ